ATHRSSRDSRSPESKAPNRPQAAAVFRPGGLARQEGAALSSPVSPEEVGIGGGMSAPPPPQLLAVREHIAANVRQLRAIVESPAFRRRVTFEGETLTRVPRGFPKAHEAAEHLKYRQFITGAPQP